MAVVVTSGRLDTESDCCCDVSCVVLSHCYAVFARVSATTLCIGLEALMDLSCDFVTANEIQGYICESIPAIKNEKTLNVI